MINGVLIQVPQADDLDKVFGVVELVHTGQNTSVDIADALDMVVRQGFYYASAAVQMGLIENNEGIYTLTHEGEAYIKASAEDKHKLRIKAVFRTPVMQHLAGVLEIKRPSKSHLHLFEDDKFVSDNIEELGYAPETASRRATTIRAWMKACA